MLLQIDSGKSTVGVGREVGDAMFAVHVAHQLTPKRLRQITEFIDRHLDQPLSVVQMVLAKHPHARLLVMTTYDGDEDIFRCLSQGAKGYLLKDAPRTEILSAIRAVSEDRPYASSSVASKALQRMAKPSLTQRELGVLQLLAEGRSNKDIARRLSITEGTAKTHVKAILTKLDAISRTEAVAVAHKRGLVRL